jgi:hypothetical protein
MFESFANYREANATFNAALIDWTRRVAGAVVEAYDFSGFATVVDVGGHGALRTEILWGNQRAQGIPFDLPRVVADAGAFRQASR